MCARMAKLKPRRYKAADVEPTTVTVADTKPQAYDAALTTLFAKSVGINLQSNIGATADTL